MRTKQINTVGAPKVEHISSMPRRKGYLEGQLRQHKEIAVVEIMDACQRARGVTGITADLQGL